MKKLVLTRARHEVGSFLSVLGSLRETRLTAVLGYLIARFPKEFGNLLGFHYSSINEISVEETDKDDRYDLLIDRSEAKHIVEGKVGPIQRVGQLNRYIRRVRRASGQKPALTLVDDGSEFRQSRLRTFSEIEEQVSKLKFVTWAEVADVCRELSRKRSYFKADPVGAIIAHQTALHLEEHNMTKEPQPEIYLRDVSDIASVRLYFRHRFYKCQSKFYNSARRNLYFAPYFTKPMASEIRDCNLVPIGEGISFVSRIEDVKVMEKRDVLSYLKEINHPDPRDAAQIIRRSSGRSEVLLLKLGEPRLMFVSPVTKAKLKKVIPFGTGAMGSRSCAFDDLLAATGR